MDRIAVAAYQAYNQNIHRPRRELLENHDKPKKISERDRDDPDGGAIGDTEARQHDSG